jgi:hypothetical protein
MHDLILLNTFSNEFVASWPSKIINTSHTRLVRPAGAHQLATWLTSQGFNVKVIDFSNHIETQSLVNIIRKNTSANTKAIGVSTTFMERSSKDFNEPKWLLDLRQELADLNVEWLLGGTKNNYSLPNRYKWKIFDGYAEDSMLEYLNTVTCRTNFKKFEITEFEKFYLPRLHIEPSEFLAIELGRGCQFKCKFCNFSMLGKKKNSYIRNLHHFREELIRLYELYGTTNYYITDDTVNESYEKIAGLAEIASSLPFKFNWVGYLRLDLIYSNPKTISLLKDTGLMSAYFGIESFNSTASKVIGKGWNGVHGKNFLIELKNNWKTDITFHCSLIVGLPGEDEESINTTQKWFIDNQMHSWSWNGLYLNKIPHFTSSEFDKNYEQYGYRFPSSSPVNWENDFWTKTLADEKAALLNNESLPYKKTGPWLLGELASTGGVTVDEIKHLKHAELPYATINSATELFLQKYTNILLNE